MPLMIQLLQPNVTVTPLGDEAKLLQFTDEQSGIVVAVPIPNETAEQIGDALKGVATSKVEVVPAAALHALKETR